MIIISRLPTNLQAVWLCKSIRLEAHTDNKAAYAEEDGHITKRNIKKVSIFVDCPTAFSQQIATSLNEPLM